MKSHQRRKMPHWLCRRLSLIFTAALLCAPALPGGVGTWTSAGPTGGRLWSVVIHPQNSSVLYAASIQAGIFKTTDGAATWTAMNNGLPILPVWALAINPTGTIVYAGISGWGVYRTTDGGASWMGSSVGLTDLGVLSLGQDPLSPCTLYAGTWSSGVFKSTDCAQTWHPTGLHVPQVKLVTVDPSKPGAVYAANYTQGIFRTVDGGTTWLQKNTGLVDLNVNAIFADPSTPGTAYAATVFGAVKTINNGKNWTPLGNTLPSYGVLVFAIQPGAVPVLFANTTFNGTYRSFDGGASWSPSNTGMPSPLPRFRAMAVSSSAVYGASDGRGILKSIDSGANWTLSNYGMKDVFVQGMAVDPHDTKTVYASAYVYGFSKSTDGSGSWGPTDATDGLFGNLAIDSSTPATLYLATGFSGILKSIDGGANWNAFNSGLPETGTFLVTVDPLTPATVYTALIEGVYKTTTAGASWSPANAGLLKSQVPMRCLVIDPVSPSNLYACTWGGVYKSVDGAATWQFSSTGLIIPAIASLAIDPQMTSTLYASTDLGVGGMYKSIDGGQSWSQLDETFPYGVTALAVDPSDSNVVYAGTLVAGVYKSTDAGATWAPFNQGMESASVQKIIVDPNDSRHIYASTWQGVFEIRQGPMTFVTIPPCRVIDTRSPTAPLGGPALKANADRNFLIAGACGIPSSAWAVSVNATVTQPSAPGSLTVYPVDTSCPVTSLISFSANQTRANNSIIQLGPAGDFLVRGTFSSGMVHFILDVNGYFQ